MSRQFDVFPNPDAADAAHRPLLLVLQSDFISGLHSTVVAPLVPRARMTGASRLNPMLSVNGAEYWLATHELFAIDRRLLRAPLANLAESRSAVIGALDFVFTGF